jgi:hypothetical protein
MTNRNNMRVHIPNLSELQRAREDVAAVLFPTGRGEAEQAESRIIRQSDDDRTTALARTRIDIERALRESLGKQTYLPADNADTIKFANLSKLFEMAAGIYPPLAPLRRRSSARAHNSVRAFGRPDWSAFNERQKPRISLHFVRSASCKKCPLRQALPNVASEEFPTSR